MNIAAAISAAAPVEFDDEAAAVLTLAAHGDLDHLDESASALSAKQERTTGALSEARRRRDEVRSEAQTAQKALQAGRDALSELERERALQLERTSHLTQQAELRLRDLPDDVASAVRSRDRRVVERLDDRLASLAGAPEDLQRLETAETELTGVTATLTAIQDELALIPEEHRLPVAAAQSALDIADENRRMAQEHRDHARDEHTHLVDAHRTRAQLGAELSDSRTQARVARRLAGLLGKNELQGRLLTAATNGVEAYANDTLARISGGTLELELRGDDGDGASLEILVKDRSSAEEPLEVAFISGSQKFRVAVAIAAGLGQYLGGHTAIRSLIIDEGFGSLDSDGRQRMIEELRGLADHLDRIIVVSHQDDFTDRTLFPTGFVLRKEGTRTVVERVG
jgi:DNA repair exonuclease SbcCD ATPase subunit